MQTKAEIDSRTHRLKISLYYIVIIQTITMIGMIIYQILDFNPGDNSENVLLYEEQFVSFWAAVTFIDAILFVVVLILKRKKMIQLGKVDDLVKFLSMVTCAFTSMASIFLAGDKQYIGGAILAVVSITLTTVEFFIDKITSDKMKDTQANIVKQLEKDIAKSKEQYKKIEKKIDETVGTKTAQKKTKK